MMRIAHGVVRTLREGIFGGIVFISVSIAPTCAAEDSSMPKYRTSAAAICWFEDDQVVVSHQDDALQRSTQKLLLRATGIGFDDQRDRGSWEQ